MNLKTQYPCLGRQGQQSTAYYPSFMLHWCVQVESGRVWVSMISLSMEKLPNPYEAEQGKKKVLQEERERAIC
jgi:hypothetical protein